jgi:hypothetical protein
MQEENADFDESHTTEKETTDSASDKSEEETADVEDNGDDPIVGKVHYRMKQKLIQTSQTFDA